MAAATCYGTLCRAELRLEYLHANSTTHDFLFGAVAELIDNSRDAGATRLDIFTVNNETLQGGFMLCFLDNGCGMTPREATDVVYFGRSSKRTISKMIGHYGNGLKSGAMRIGKDFILFTKKENTMTCLLFSQTFCEMEGLTEVIIPILSWSSTTRNPVMDDPEKFATQLSIICKYSPFKSEAELMKQFDAIYGERGTLVVIYNLKLMLNGEPELDIQTDEEDILIAGALEKKYPYISLFKEVAINEPKTAEVELNSAKRAAKEAKGGEKHLQDSVLHGRSEVAQIAEWDAMGNDKRIRSKLRQRKSKTLFLIFGINIQDRSRDGMLIYSNGRLIRMFEKVGPQNKLGSYLGAGAVGMVDVPLEVMEPTHNKQSFANVKQYNHLLKSMERCLVQYWKDIGISQKGEIFFWNDFGYLGASWNEKPSDIIQYKRRRAVEIPDIVQCDICLKWRLLSLDTDINKEGHRDIWSCPENKCHVPEDLPSIPLGTFLPSSQSLNDKEKLLIDSIQQCQSKLKNLPLQKCYLVQPHTVVQRTEDYRTVKDKNETIEKTVCRRKAFHKDPSPACSRLIKNSANKRPVQKSSLQKQPPAKQKICSQRKWHPHQEAKHPLSEPENRKNHNISMPLPLEVQDEQPSKKEPMDIKIETDSEPEVICIIISDSESEDLLKDKDFAFEHKDEEKPKQGDDIQLDLTTYITPEEKDLCGTDSKSGSKDKSKEGQEEQALVDRQDSDAAVSHRWESSQRSPENKMIETLTDHIKEFLLYFLPKCSFSREYLTCMSTQDILSMFKVKGHSEPNENVPLEIHQHFLQYKRQRSDEIQAINQHILEPILTTEAKIRLCEVQEKTVQERLNHLRGKMAQLLLKIHPHLLINNLEDIDGYLEEIQNEEHLGFM